MEREYRHTIEQSTESTLAPVLVEFVKWVLRSAGEHGIRRIYFLARDGWPMYQAARILAEGRDPEIDCRYLKCSRYALRIPAFHLLGRSAVQQICMGGISVTLRKVLRRGGLTDQEIQETARAMGRRDDLDRILSYQEVRDLRGPLAQTELFWRYVSAHAEEAYGAAVGYLRREGLMDGIDYAIADSGWTGSIQRTLSLITASAGYRGRITGYYFGLYHIPADAEKKDYHAYYFGPVGKIRRKVYFSNSLFECICSEPSRMTVGYRRSGEGYEPTAEEGRIGNREELELIHGIVERRAGEEAERLPVRPALWKTDIGRRLLRRLEQLMGRPGRAQAEAFGRMKFTDDVLDAGHLLAPGLTEWEIRQNHFWAKLLVLTGIRRQPVKESAWIEGSIVRSGGAVRWHLLQSRIYKYLLYIKKDILERIK